MQLVKHQWLEIDEKFPTPRYSFNQENSDQVKKRYGPLPLQSPLQLPAYSVMQQTIYAQWTLAN
jgi:hypothetical protein